MMDGRTSEIGRKQFFPILTKKSNCMKKKYWTRYRIFNVSFIMIWVSAILLIIEKYITGTYFSAFIGIISSGTSIQNISGNNSIMVLILFIILLFRWGG